MSKYFISFSAFTLLMVQSIFCCQATAQTSIKVNDLLPAIGSWQGSLTYLDYTTNKPFTMPANIDIEQIANSNKFLFRNSFPKEPNANWTDTIILSKDGTMINDEKIKSTKTLADGNLEIITEKTGVDGNEKKTALLRHTYTIGKNIFIRRKDVQFQEQKEWINRHEYKYAVRQKILKP